MRQCEFCGKTYQPKTNMQELQRFCSNRCRLKSFRAERRAKEPQPTKVHCYECDTLHSRPKSNYCCRNCRLKAWRRIRKGGSDISDYAMEQRLERMKQLRG